MSVVQITKACTLSCSYCFDKVGQDEAKGKKITISNDVFDKYLSRMGEFFKSEPENKNICISGGEPSLHPEFMKMVNKAIYSGFSIYLLSNFTFSDIKAKFLKQFFDNGKMTSLVNINSPYSNYAGMNKGLWIRTMMNLKYLENPGIRLSFNIFDPDENYDFIFEVLEKYPKLDKTIRLGVVNPIVSDLRKNETYVFDDKNIIDGKNESTWSFYKRLGKITDDLVEKLTKKGYKIYLDCGVGWCIFNSNTIKTINENGGKTHGCSLPNDEVGINGQYSSCYTLFNYGNEDGELNIENHSIKKSRWKFILKTDFFKDHYLILPKCITCPLLKKGCPRFCVSNNIAYYEKLFKDGISKNVNEEYYNKLDNLTKEYIFIEYLISKNYIKDALIYLQGLDDENNSLKKSEYNEKLSFRFFIYDILANFLDNGNRKEGLDRINKLMTTISEKNIKLVEKDFKLLKISEILIKEYKIS